MPAYLNPLTVLGLQDIDPRQLDAATLRKAKKRVYSERSLEGRTDLDYLGKSFTRHDLEVALDRCTDPVWLTAYAAATRYPGLNRFLVQEQVAPGQIPAAVWADERLQPVLRTFLPSVYPTVLHRAYLRDEVSACAELFRWPVTQYISRETAFGPTYQEIRQGLRAYKEAVQYYLSDPESSGARPLFGVQVLREHFPRQSIPQLPEYFHDLLRAAANVTLRLLAVAQQQDPALAKAHRDYVSSFPGLSAEQRSVFARFLPALEHNSRSRWDVDYRREKSLKADATYDSAFALATIGLVVVIFIFRLILFSSTPDKRHEFQYQQPERVYDAAFLRRLQRSARHEIEITRARNTAELQELHRTGDSALLKFRLRQVYHWEEDLVSSLPAAIQARNQDWQQATFREFRTELAATAAETARDTTSQ